jgi:hypothetical protein
VFGLARDDFSYCNRILGKENYEFIDIIISHPGFDRFVLNPTLRVNF